MLLIHIDCSERTAIDITFTWELRSILLQLRWWWWWLALTHRESQKQHVCVCVHIAWLMRSNAKTKVIHFNILQRIPVAASISFHFSFSFIWKLWCALHSTTTGLSFSTHAMPISDIVYPHTHTHGYAYDAHTLCTNAFDWSWTSTTFGMHLVIENE